MIPVAIVVFAEQIPIPMLQVVDVVTEMSGGAFSINNPFTALFYALVITMFPIGLKIAYNALNPVAFIKNNAAPRANYSHKGVTDKLYARFEAAEANGFEALPMFGIAVLAALQAGVAKDVVTLHAAFWCICRIGYIAAYLFSAGPIAVPMGLVRTSFWAPSVITIAKLLILAAAAGN